jgi:hypothetical protein
VLVGFALQKQVSEANMQTGGYGELVKRRLNLPSTPALVATAGDRPITSSRTAP